MSSPDFPDRFKIREFHGLTGRKFGILSDIKTLKENSELLPGSPDVRALAPRGRLYPCHTKL